MLQHKGQADAEPVCLKPECKMAANRSLGCTLICSKVHRLPQVIIENKMKRRYVAVLIFHMPLRAQSAWRTGSWNLSEAEAISSVIYHSRGPSAAADFCLFRRFLVLSIRVRLEDCASERRRSLSLGFFRLLFAYHQRIFSDKALFEWVR